VRNWLTLWLCFCLLLSSPVRGDCCLRTAGPGPADGVATVVADAADLPCHRHHAVANDPAQPTDPTPPDPATDPSGCEHCSCPCRIAAMPVVVALPGLLPPPAFAPVSLSRVVVAGERIPPLPPPIA
jgi:hypothetical protein